MTNLAAQLIQKQIEQSLAAEAERNLTLNPDYQEFIKVQYVLMEAYELKPWFKLWVYLRHEDQIGSGRPVLPLDFVCDRLKVGSSTIFRWLKEGKEAGAFREYHRHKNEKGEHILTTVLTSRDNLALSKDVQDIGKAALIPFTIFSMSHCAKLLTLITAEQKQRHSNYKSRLASRGTESAKAWKSADDLLDMGKAILFPNETQGDGNHHILSVSNRFLTVNRFTPVVGASQKAIAYATGFKERRVRNHLKDVFKLQLVKHVPHLSIAVNALLFEKRQGGTELNEDGQLAHWVEEEGRYRSVKDGKHYIYKGMVLEKFTNLYDLPIIFCNPKFARNQYKTKLYPKYQESLRAEAAGVEPVAGCVLAGEGKVSEEVIYVGSN